MSPVPKTSAIPATRALGDVPSGITHQNGSILHTPWAWMLRDPWLDRVGVGLSKNKGPTWPSLNCWQSKDGENDEKTSGFWGSLLLDNHITWVYRINLCNVIYPHNVIWACRTVFPQDCQFSGFGYTVYISFAHTHVFCRDCGYKRQLSFTVYETPHTRIVG